MKVTWVLGAGFSRSLGGPLLEDFFTPMWDTIVHETLPHVCDENDRSVRDAIGILSEMASMNESSTGRSKRTWRNAEEFCELLEEAAQINGERAKRMLGWYSKDNPTQKYPKEGSADAEFWRKVCRSYFATACHAFVASVKNPKETERWIPYLRWAKSIKNMDRIVSFNYDIVVERSFETIGRELDVSFPDKGLKGKQPALFKLHGSVDWNEQQDNSLSLIHENSIIHTIADLTSLTMIAMPGPVKKLLAENFWSEHWEAGLKAIREAEVLVFIGYRFPESDALAKTKILDQIAESKVRRVRIVLAQLPNERDVCRLLDMLKWKFVKMTRIDDTKLQLERSGRQYPLEVFVERMGAEDFLAVFEYDHL